MTGMKIWVVYNGDGPLKYLLSISSLNPPLANRPTSFMSSSLAGRSGSLSIPSAAIFMLVGWPSGVCLKS